MPAHNFSSSTATVPGTQLVGCRLSPALQTSGCLLLTQNGVLSLPILLFKIKKVAGCELSKEAAASPYCFLSKAALQRALHWLEHLRDEGSSIS